MRCMRIVSLLADRQGKQSVFSPIHNLIGHKTTKKGHIVSHQETLLAQPFYNITLTLLLQIGAAENQTRVGKK